MISCSKSTNMEYFGDCFDSPNALKENSFYIKAFKTAASGAATSPVSDVLCSASRGGTSRANTWCGKSGCRWKQQQVRETDRPHTHLTPAAPGPNTAGESYLHLRNSVYE